MSTENTEPQLRALADALPQVIFLQDAQGTVLYVSKAWRSYTGHAQLSDALLEQCVHADDLAAYRAVAAQARRLRQPWHAELRLRRADGEYRWFLARGQPSDAGWAGSLVNIDFQKRQADVLRKAHDELQRANEALRRADRRKDEFISVLAHELRNPLAPLRNAVHLLQRAPQASSAGSAVAIIDRQLRHLVRLVDDLLEVARINSGRIELERARVHIRDVLHDAIEGSRPQLLARGHQLTMHLGEAERAVVDGDRTRLVQVFVNLLNNAAKYTPDNGYIDVHASVSAGAVIVVVKDNGVGIRSDLLPHVFDLFSRADSRGRGDAGLGVGLHLVRSLLQLHDGAINAYSEGPGKGATFEVRLPLLTNQDVVLTADEIDTPAAQPGLRVLVCDDNVDAATALGALLESVGLSATVVFGGRAALDALQSASFDLALLDVGMPGIDGLRVVHELRRLPGPGRPLLVALTGWSQPSDMAATELAGFDMHLVKPLEWDALQSLLESVHARRTAGANGSGNVRPVRGSGETAQENQDTAARTR